MTPNIFRITDLNPINRKPVEGALERHQGIPGFDQQRYSRAQIVCVGAGGLIGGVAQGLARRGIGAITVLDHDEVEFTNLNRQRFYPSDIGDNKASVTPATRT